VEIVRNEQAQGFARAANRGLAAARGGLLLLLNSDTELQADSFATWWTRSRRTRASVPPVPRS
jgi:GT2 family glycosyltransferase